jgi:hypothetical protein
VGKRTDAPDGGRMFSVMTVRTPRLDIELPLNMRNVDAGVTSSSKAMTPVVADP